MNTLILYMICGHIRVPARLGPIETIEAACWRCRSPHGNYSSDPSSSLRQAWERELA